MCGYLNQIKNFINEVNTRGFLLSFVDLHNQSIPNMSYIRYEFWLEGHLFDSKVFEAHTIEEMCTEGIPEVRRLMDERIPGRFTD